MDNFSPYAKATNIVLNEKTNFSSACNLAINLGFRALFSPPCFLSSLIKHTKNTAIKPGALIDYPAGSDLTSVRVYSSKQSELLGAQEIAVVINLLATNDLSAMQNDIKTICQNVDIPVSAILDTRFFPVESAIEVFSCLSQTRLCKIILNLHNISSLEGYIDAAKNTTLKDMAIFTENTTAACLEKMSALGVSSFWLNSSDAFPLAKQ